ncbi:MAG: flagellar hook capping family protein [Alphaproteobacteria bacterium]|nr:flagellar hook capping family protein [Alphaproteobacteria bacterium]
MEINSATAVQSAADVSSQKLNQDFDQFLRLLTTQLQNQDPLNPMDSHEFTNQLVQFSGVEQAIKTNKNLENLLSLQTLNMTALGVSFIGKNVEVQGNNFLADGQGNYNLGYQLPQTANAGTITILDSSGQLVYSRDAELSAGKHDFTWNGLDNSGVPVPPGSYELRVSALTEENVSLNPTTYVPGYVNGLESDQNGNLLLSVDGQSIPITGVSKISEAPSS